MNHLSEEQLFNRIANHVVGNWHHLTDDEQLIFSLSEAQAALTEVTIIKEGMRHSAFYRLGFLPDWKAYLTISQMLERHERIVEMISDDTMILIDRESRLSIFERRADQVFAESVINSVCNER